MPSQRPSRRKMLEACGEIGPEDGADPREFAKARQFQHKALRRKAPGAPPEPGRKAFQLGRQVAEILDHLLAGECQEDVLKDLRVASVEPAPHATRLLVSLSWRDGPEQADVRATLEALRRASGWLRAEVATSVNRRKAPILVFRLVVPEIHQ